MNSRPSAGPTVLIAINRQTLAELLSPENREHRRHIGERLDAAADALILGSDLITEVDTRPSPAERPGIDPSVAATVLAHLTSTVGLIVSAAPLRDHPYNLARRIASIDHASAGRAGLAIAIADPAVPCGSPWTTAKPVDAAADAVVAVRELWRSFPVKVIVADRESGVFAESHHIVAIDHRGAYDITGPLQVPTSPQVWPPVIAWAGPGTDPVDTVADVVIGTDDPRFEIYLPHDLVELRSVIDRDRAHPAETRGTSLRERLGLLPASPPSGGRTVFDAPPPGGDHVR
ncbi:LLM class flavin-dependent oxidoreductase [Gordonia rubripertincta]|uniref:LLM class flavin-dependent oxidoreductase n=1 Tax=Gordonia rubripertincta TaxID=36822 RepID=UPI000B8D3184|nr:LLM class flavin-dependent oxidoreductase [Gordonia rubripertincta]ASR01692.1 Nitrilotriacetate monooxygenase component A [Gordonia rubripertincta]